MYYNYNDYQIDDEGLPSADLLWKNSDYLSWLKNEAFGRFFYIPYPEIQKNILITLIFINSKAVPNKVGLPHFYFHSFKPNSGKSTFAKYISFHYNPECFIYIPEDISGASLRNIFDAVSSKNQPAYALLDNFHPVKTVDRLGAFYGRLLKYERSESVVKVAQPGTKQMLKFNTFCLKVFTSIFALDEKTKELASRCLYLRFEESPYKLDDLANYSWNYSLATEYYKVWGDSQKISQTMNSIFKEINKFIGNETKDFPLKNRQLQLIKYLVAVGLLINLFPDVENAFKYYIQYYEWVSSLNTESNSTLYLLLHEYVNKVHPYRVLQSLKVYGNESDLDINVIYFDHLFNFVANNLPISKTLSVEREISTLMKLLGWNNTVVSNKNGDVYILYIRE